MSQANEAANKPAWIATSAKLSTSLHCSREECQLVPGLEIDW